MLHGSKGLLWSVWLLGTVWEMDLTWIPISSSITRVPDVRWLGVSVVVTMSTAGVTQSMDGSAAEYDVYSVV